MAALISKKCSCRSPAAGAKSWSRCRDHAGSVPSGDAACRRGPVLAGAGLGDAAALSLYSAQLLAAHLGAALLADPADADLGVHEPVPLSEQQLRRPRLRGAAGGSDAVGFAVPLTAWPVDLVPRGDVGAQSRAALRDAAAALRMAVVAAGDERDPGDDRGGAGGVVGDPALPLLDLRHGPALARLLCRADGDGVGLGTGDLRRHIAARHGRREPRLDRDLRAGAALLRLLPGDDPARLAAAGRLVPALDLCL